MLFLLLFLFFCTQTVFAKKSPESSPIVPSATPLSSQVSSTPVPASTQIPDTIITSDTIWNSSGSPYIIKNKLTIDKDASLTIDSGVVIKLHPGAVIEVDGTISTKGTEHNSVVFTSINGPAFGGSGITGPECYWDMIDISAAGNLMPAIQN